MGNKITRRRPVIDERYTRPQGLYPCRDVDQRKLRRLILESKLAPCYPGAEEADKDLEECPICFLQYPSLNRSKCCAKGVCTECFLQMKAPHAARPTQCPFCKTPCYAVEYRGAKTLEEKGMEQAEEQKVIEAKIRMRQQELQDDEEREQRREEDIRAGRIRIQTPSNNHLTAIDEVEGVNWRSGWGSADRQPQALASSALGERNTSGMDPYALWVDGDYQRAGGLDITAPVQQSISSNIMPSVAQQQADTDFSVPQLPLGAPRARDREDEFDLDLEDIMVMEAIWLSLQEQGARLRSAAAELIQTAPNRMTEISLDSESDDDPPPLHPVPELEPWQPHSGRQGIATGGLAGAIAALTERQAVEGDTIPPSQPSTFPSLPDLENTENEPERYQRVGDQSTSFASSVPSASDFVLDNQSRVRRLESVTRHNPLQTTSGPSNLTDLHLSENMGKDGGYDSGPSCSFPITMHHVGHNPLLQTISRPSDLGDLELFESMGEDGGYDSGSSCSFPIPMCHVGHNPLLQTTSGPSDIGDLHLSESMGEDGGYDSGSSCSFPIAMRHVGHNPLLQTISGLSNLGDLHLYESMGEDGGYDSGASCSFPIAMRHVPMKAGEGYVSERSGGVHNEKVVLRDGFEEQMVLAMALSIADAQTRVHQGDSRSGPLVQPAHMGH